MIIRRVGDYFSILGISFGELEDLVSGHDNMYHECEYDSIEEIRQALTGKASHDVIPGEVR